jgi:hypothetical protein
MSTRHRIACAVLMLAALLAVADGEPFDYFASAWGLIGLKDYRDATRVTPANQLLLANKTRLQLRIGPQLAPPSRAQTKTLLDGWLPVARCEMLDLSRTANTDPFIAPFSAKKPGKFLFTGLRTGLQEVGGVPFRVLDPAQNSGRGLVVLEGAHTSSKFPRQVAIPAGRQGARLFLLGNVHSWRSGGEGVGDWGAVAEYVIHYADGQTQTVPSVSRHRTGERRAAQGRE